MTFVNEQIVALGTGSAGAHALPSVARAEIPSAVRKAGAQAVATYRAALAFEQLLVRELLDSVDLAGSTGTAQPLVAGRVADALAEAVTNGHGLGIADELYRALRVGSDAAGAEAR